VTYEVVLADRKAAVLAPSTIKCLRGMPTVNLTSGCAHGCLYCYARGYNMFPGEGRVVVYANTFEKLKAELPRKRKRPAAVYFSPSTDAFQPLPEVLDLGYRCMEHLLESGVGVAILTKGLIPERHMRLFEAHAALVQAQIDVATLDAEAQKAFEPGAAAPAARVAQAARPGWREALFESFRDGKRLGLAAEKSLVTSLSIDRRAAIYERARAAAARCGITTRVCACKNADMAADACTIAGVWRTAAEATLFGAAEA
jgi:hypothetical protein